MAHVFFRTGRSTMVWASKQAGMEKGERADWKAGFVA
jgi:hypothetical protein